RHLKLGQAVATWRYSDAASRTIGFMSRFATEPKTFQPLTLWRPIAGGKPQWRWKSWPDPRPLYGLAELTNKPTAPVVVVEGEKACDAARQLLPGFAVVTSPHGSKAAEKADWLPLRDRAVVVWPDADSPGLDYARAV